MTTPSPWKIRKNEPNEEYWVTDVHYDAGPAKIIRKIEDARLIAAAPDMLHALYTALPFVEDALDDATYNREKVQAKLDEIKAVIYKAEGK